jgi:selenocysteine lyase/cysteine desulfurase
MSAKAATLVAVSAVQSADGSRFAYVVCSAYKWLLSPRGTAFPAVRPDAGERLTPHTARWYAAGALGPGVRAAAPPGRDRQAVRRLVRLSCHLPATEADVDRALEALT